MGADNKNEKVGNSNSVPKQTYFNSEITIIYLFKTRRPTWPVSLS